MVFSRRIALLALFALIASISAAFGCRSRAGILAQANVPIGVYVRSVLAANGRSGRITAFPTVQIYDAGGRLIFQSHYVSDEVAVLQGLPDSAQALKPIAGAASMETAIAGIPGLQSRPDILGQRNALTVVVISLDGCRACSVLNETLLSVQQRLLDRGEDMILVSVEQPG